MHLIHRWSRWKKKDTQYWENGKVAGVTTKQERECEKCGLVRKKEL